MRIVVVGASGNVGTAVLRRLIGDGGHEVIGVSRRKPDGGGVYDLVEQWHCVDVADPSAQHRLTDVFRAADAVVHLAWGFQPTRDPQYLRRVGVEGSARVLAAADQAGVAHLVHMSSVGAYATKSGDSPVDETYPVTGVPGSLYSAHKVAAERHLDEYEAGGGRVVITRTRPGFVLQADAGAALTRYGLPAYLPVRLLRRLPVLPLDRRLVVPVIHADDLADAITRILTRRAGGAFNLAASPALTRDDLAALFGAHPIQLPRSVLRAVVAGTWRAHLQPLDAGWIDLAFSVPLMSTDRARSVLDWSAEIAATDAFAQTLAAMAAGRGATGPVLRGRSMTDQVRRSVTRGSVSRRRVP